MAGAMYRFPVTAAGARGPRWGVAIAALVLIGCGEPPIYTRIDGNGHDAAASGAGGSRVGGSGGRAASDAGGTGGPGDAGAAGGAFGVGGAAVGLGAGGALGV